LPTEDEVWDVIRTSKVVQGATNPFDVVTIKTASQYGRIGSMLISNQNGGGANASGHIYLLLEKMANMDSAVFLVNHEIGHSTHMPKSIGTQKLLIIKFKRFPRLMDMPRRRMFMNMFYDAYLNWVIVMHGTINDSYPDSFARHMLVTYDCGEFVGHSEGKKIEDSWELLYRINMYAAEISVGNITSKSIGNLTTKHKEWINKILEGFSLAQIDYWKGNDIAIEYYDKFYEYFDSIGNNDDAIPFSGAEKKQITKTKFDLDLFTQKAKAKGLTDKQIKDYIDRVTPVIDKVGS